jgi:hypothetical protein
MSSTLIVDTIRNTANSVNIQTTYLQRRLVQRVNRWFRGGIWNPGNTYYEVPGSFLNITPLYDNSYLLYSYRCPLGHAWNAHSITHWIFQVNGTEFARHTRSVDHQESGHNHRWEVPSWGKGRSGSMGYYTRNYNSGNHGAHFNARRYIDGSDSTRSVPSFVSIEEYLPAP